MARLGLVSVLAILGAFGCGPRIYRRSYVQYEQPQYVQQPQYVEQPQYAQPPPQYEQPQYQQPQVQVSGTLLYLPVPGLVATMIQSIVVQSSDGRVFQLGPQDVQPSLAGRIALTLPAGVTTGTVTITAMGQTLSIPFHVAVSMDAGPVIGSAPPQSNPACAAIAGRWVGNITSDPRSSAVVDLEILGDCRTVRGFVHLDAPSTGSVDSTVVGTWEAGSYRLIARDTQLFNVVARPGGSFCPTERYELQMHSDGTLRGQNVVTQAPCRGVSPVYLQRQ